MKKIILFLLILALTNCSTKKLTKRHGLINLEKKKDKISIGKSNKNDVLEIFGPPSTISTFDENIWIYIELEKINQSIIKLGKKKINKNDSLIVKFDSRSLVENVNLVNIDNMNNLKILEKDTQMDLQKNSKLYNVLSSLREKINAPTRRRQNK